ncbi:flagellar biosynthesis protein FlgN [Treponema socranskii]|uniref:flagellar biosynthesis protein FlgN n=1 Tax=Treponema socranskii TaxID=53419 RepID=UPI003D918630
MQKLSQNEIDERVAVLKRFKTLLVQQRDKFREYLSVLEKQQTSIEEENTDALIAHTELEQQVVSNIAGLQKVIVPMSEMYSAIRSSAPANETLALESIQKDLAHLQSQVLAQNEKNRSMLRVHIANIQSQMERIKNPYRGSRSVYAQKQSVGSFVEVQA